MKNNHFSKHYQDLIKFDSCHLWHPYAMPLSDDHPNLLVQSANGVKIRTLQYGQLIDAMSSWWCMIHGYNHPVLNRAIKQQSKKFSHVMFGGLTHQPAIALANRLLELNSPNQTKERSLFQSVFLADSGSISVEVAIKMSLQYQILNQRKEKNKIMTVLGGYHGDTLGAMSVCDPNKGMHQLFKGILPKQIFIPRPPLSCIDAPLDSDYLKQVKDLFKQKANQVAAFIIEPIVQGAGGMRFYSKFLLREIQKLCHQHQIILIFDEIATGFGRTGKLFAYQHANVSPDILCLGKAMSGGYLNLAAVLVKPKLVKSFQTNQSPMMHGPTFMANPLASSVALASIDLLIQSNWQKKIKMIGRLIKKEFSFISISKDDKVKDVRVLGAIGVIELKEAQLAKEIQKKCLSKGVWIRPFGELVYIMPPYCIKKRQLRYVCRTIVDIINHS